MTVIDESVYRVGSETLENEEVRPQKYGYSVSYVQGSETGRRVGSFIPEFLKVFIVFAPAVVLMALAVFMWLGVDV